MPLVERSFRSAAVAIGLPACGLLACSGSDGSVLAMKSGADDAVLSADASARTPSDAAPAAQMQTQTASPPPSGGPYVGRGDNFAPPLDAMVRAVTADASVDGAAADSGPATPVDLCPVTFSVTNAFVDGFLFKNVVVGGDVAALGVWDPSKALPMTAGAQFGAWTLGVPLPDGASIHFKFGLTDATGKVTWEGTSSSADRTLLVSCADGDALHYAGEYSALDAGL
jgi:hypothetical protein